MKIERILDGLFAKRVHITFVEKSPAYDISVVKRATDDDYWQPAKIIVQSQTIDINYVYIMQAALSIAIEEAKKLDAMWPVGSQIEVNPK